MAFKVFTGLTALESCAKDLVWEGEAFFLLTKGLAVSKLLKDLGANYGFSVVVSEKITDTFVGTLKDQSPQEILSTLCSLYHLTWYFDGYTLYICKASEVKRMLITPNYLTFENLLEYLTEGDVLDEKSSSLKKISGFNAFEVVGPPELLFRVKQLVEELDQHAEAIEKNQERVEIFPLKHAWAQDQTVEHKGSSFVVPGVATLLAQLVGPEANKSQNPEQERQEFPIISTDTRKNAVVVRDTAFKLAKYKKLIEALDQEQQQVEISVSIIDIAADNYKHLGLELGLELKGPWAEKSVQASAGTLGGGRETSGVARGIGISKTIKDSLSFYARLHALENESKAKIIAQPSIVTLNNTKAILDRSETFYTKLISPKDAKLEAIVSGTLLEVTPCLAMGPKGVETVRLQIHLQDGKSDRGRELSSLPEVQSSEILTQASLNPEEGLLLGGFVREEQKVEKAMVPFLGRIPVLGKLFSETKTTQSRLVRLFFIKALPVQLAHFDSDRIQEQPFQKALEEVKKEGEQMGYFTEQNQKNTELLSSTSLRTIDLRGADLNVGPGEDEEEESDSDRLATSDPDDEEFEED